MNKKTQDSSADHRLDITDQICPMTFVRTKLLIEQMAPGEVAEVRLKGKEPLENVPRSVEQIGHTVLGLEPESGDAAPDGVHLLRIRKEDRKKPRKA